MEAPKSQGSQSTLKHRHSSPRRIPIFGMRKHQLMCMPHPSVHLSLFLSLYCTLGRPPGAWLRTVSHHHTRSEPSGPATAPTISFGDRTFCMCTRDVGRERGCQSWGDRVVVKRGGGGGVQKQSRRGAGCEDIIYTNGSDPTVAGQIPHTCTYGPLSQGAGQDVTFCCAMGQGGMQIRDPYVIQIIIRTMNGSHATIHCPGPGPEQTSGHARRHTQRQTCRGIHVKVPLAARARLPAAPAHAASKTRRPNGASDPSIALSFK